MAKTSNPKVVGPDHYAVEIKKVPEAAAQSFEVYDLGYVDGANGLKILAGADPALIAGRILEGASGIASTKLEVELFKPTNIVRMLCSDGAALSTSDNFPLGSKFGIVDIGGIWHVDSSDTINTRVIIKNQLMIDDQTYDNKVEVVFLETYCQFR